MSDIARSTSSSEHPRLWIDELLEAHRAVLGALDRACADTVHKRNAKGDIVHAVYHLYDPTEVDVVLAKRGIQLGLLRDGEWLQAGEVVAGGQVFPDEAMDRIGFVSWLDTSSLRPGRYTLLAILPDYGNRSVPHLAEEFELLPRPAATSAAQVSSPR